MFRKNLIVLLLLCACSSSFGQVITPFSIRFQTTQKGGIRYLSNTAVTCNGAAGCSTAQVELPPAGTGYDNNFTAAYVDIDADGTTFSSSSETLSLPTCSQVTWAGLYWGGEITNAAADYATRNQCKIKVGTGTYTNLTADALQDNTIGFTTYHCFKDVTSIVQSGGLTSTFTVANVAARIGGTNRFAGWTIVVVYKNDLQPMRNLTVFNGLSNVSTANLVTDITVAGFLTPLSGPVTFEIGAVSYDGDRSLTGDQLQFNGGSGFVNISDATNSTTDVFNGTLSYNGVAKTAATNNPGYTNTLGYDADIFIPNNTAKNYIGNSATMATLRLTTASSGGETYLTQIVTMAIDVYEPDLRAAVRSQDLNGGSLVPGDIIEYTVAGLNIGSDPSVNTYITDTLELNIAFVPGSITIIYGPNAGAKTDAASDDQAEYIAASRTVRVRAGTGANGTTGGTMMNSTLGTDSTVFKFHAMVTGDCAVLSCDAVINNQAFIGGTGNISGNTFNNASNPGIFDGFGCPIPGSTANTISHSCGSPSASSIAGCVGGTINLFSTTSPFATYSWSGPGSFSSSAANPVRTTNATVAMAGTYTVTITVPGTSCVFTPTTIVTVNTPTQTLSGTAGSGAFTQSHDVTSAAGVYTDPSCNLISLVTASGSSPVTGSVTSKVWIENSVPVYQSKPFVARHYDIMPVTNGGTATGTITLYFLQSEFNAFNSHAGSILNLPTGASDASGISNLRVGQYPGTSTGNTGLPGSYGTAGSVIVPTSVTYNSSAGRWEVTFPTAGFGGYIIQTHAFVLPVSLVSFTATQMNNIVLLKWQTATETNSSHFIVEHSNDGRSFAALGSLPAAGNSSSLLHYSFIHNTPQKGINFYRMQQIDLDGHIHYSDIRIIDINSKAGGFSILINPVTDGVLQVQFNKTVDAVIYNASGQAILKIHAGPGSQSINIAGLSKGIYLLQADNETKKFIIE